MFHMGFHFNGGIAIPQEIETLETIQLLTVAHMAHQRITGIEVGMS